MRGYDTLERTFTVVSGVDESMDLELVAIPSHFPYRTAGLATLAGGVVLLASGLITLTFDRKEVGCTAQNKDPDGHCPWVLSTKWWGAAMLGVGAVAATLGVLFSTSHHARAPPCWRGPDPDLLGHSPVATSPVGPARDRRRAFTPSSWGDRARARS